MERRRCFYNLTSKHLAHLIDSRFLFAKKTLFIDLRSSYRTPTVSLDRAAFAKAEHISHVACEMRKMRTRVRACRCRSIMGRGRRLGPIDRVISVKLATWIGHLCNRTTGAQYVWRPYLRRTNDSAINLFTYRSVRPFIRLVPVAARVIRRQYYRETGSITSAV